MAVTRWTGLVGALVVAACGGDDGDDGGEELGTPILELAPRPAHACSEVSATTMIDDGLASGFRVIADGDRHHAVTTRNDQTVALSELELEPVALRTPSWSTAIPTLGYGPSIAAREGGGFAIAWSESSRVGVAVLDATGAQVGATRYFPTGGETYDVDIVPRYRGFALAWGGRTLDVVLLDLDGAAARAVETITTGTSIVGRLVRHQDGFAVAYADYDVDAGRYQIHVVMLDGSGTPRSVPLQLSTRTDRGNYGVFVASVGADVLVAWEEHFSPETPGDEGGHAIVRIARVTFGGFLREPVFRLQAPERGFVNVNATLLPLDGAVALSWSRGDYIAVCGGCITDNRMNLILLDPEDLAPISNIVEVAGPAGLRSAPIVSGNGRDFAYLLAIDRHARFDLAAAMVRCAPTP